MVAQYLCSAALVMRLEMQLCLENGGGSASSTSASIFEPLVVPGQGPLILSLVIPVETATD